MSMGAVSKAVSRLQNAMQRDFRALFKTEIVEEIHLLKVLMGFSCSPDVRTGSSFFPFFVWVSIF